MKADPDLCSDLFPRPEVPDRRDPLPPGSLRGLHGDSIRGQSTLHYSRQEGNTDAERHGLS